MQSVIIGLVALIVIGGGVAVVTKSDHNVKTGNNSNTAPTQSTSGQSTNSSSSSTNQTASATVTYSDTGFSPASITVNAGDKVTVKNASSSPLQFDSDPHPQHTDDTDLNAGFIASGSSQTFTVTKTGTFGFHNHLNPRDRGSITIK